MPNKIQYAQTNLLKYIDSGFKTTYGITKYNFTVIYHDKIEYISLDIKLKPNLKMEIE